MLGGDRDSLPGWVIPLRLNWDSGVGGERLDVPPLPFGIVRIEREGGFAGAGDARDDDELVAGDRDADIFEVVLAGTFDDDIFHF